MRAAAIWKHQRPMRRLKIQAGQTNGCTTVKGNLHLVKFLNNAIMKDPDQHQKDLNQAAMVVLEILQEREKHLHRLIGGNIKGGCPWIDLSWSIERKFALKNIKQLTQDIINQSYNY